MIVHWSMNGRIQCGMHQLDYQRRQNGYARLSSTSFERMVSCKTCLKKIDKHKKVKR